MEGSRAQRAESTGEGEPALSLALGFHTQARKEEMWAETMDEGLGVWVASRAGRVREDEASLLVKGIH